MPTQFIDTHAHIQFKDYPYDAGQTWADAQKAGLVKLVVVGCDLESSLNAVEFAKKNDNVYAAVAIHPHSASKFLASSGGKQGLEALLDNAVNNKIVAIGEFGLDYFYENSPKADQILLLRYHLGLAQRYNLPVCLHIRDAFEDFWKIFDTFHNSTPLEGVVHCFTGSEKELDEVLERQLNVALNGIMTFTKNDDQLAMAKKVPLDRLLLETDAPYLTPKPFRGKICKPEHVVLTAKFLAELRGETTEVIAEATTKNSIKLFKLES